MKLTYTERNGLLYPDLELPHRPTTRLESMADCDWTSLSGTAEEPTAHYWG